MIIKVFTNHKPYKYGCVLVRRNFDRLIMKVFTNHLVVYVIEVTEKIIEVTEIVLNLFIYLLFFFTK